MPGIRCAIYGCNNNVITVKKLGKDIKFYAFPKGKNLVTNTIRLEWINRCKRDDKFNPNTHYICSVHFNKLSYERDMQNELLGLPLRRILKSTAVPTLHLPNTKSSTITDRDRRHEKRERRKIISDILSNSNEPENSEQPGTSIINRNDSGEDSHKLKYEELLAVHAKLKQDYSSLKEENKKEIKRLNDLLRYYKKKNRLKLTSKDVNWNREELATAFTLRYYSKKCYLYVRNNLNYPLPSLSTLKKWVSKICRPNINEREALKDASGRYSNYPRR
ncbi:uncharacterized protein LOC116163654 [Photinus pyralis]|uniref:uncharacterized protein LOC116163654 n=1 Tax=Photinus pyralis TaxID=7054 RepID=UPI0012677468|nr:uncharacterized protein LOC116163654 [Photinus pyralis]